MLYCFCLVADHCEPLRTIVKFRFHSVFPFHIPFLSPSRLTCIRRWGSTDLSQFNSWVPMRCFFVNCMIRMYVWRFDLWLKADFDVGYDYVSGKPNEKYHISQHPSLVGHDCFFIISAFFLLFFRFCFLFFDFLLFFFFFCFFKSFRSFFFNHYGKWRQRMSTPCFCISSFRRRFNVIKKSMKFFFAYV